MTEPTTKKQSSWMIALKTYNQEQGNGKFIVPKKGSDEYSKVREIMDRYKTENNIVTKPSKPRVKKVKSEVVAQSIVEPTVENPPVIEPKKVKTVRKKKLPSLHVVATAPDVDIGKLSKEELIKELLSKL